MLVSTLVTFLKKQYPDYSSQNLLDIINEVHRICLTTKPVGQMRLYEANSTNGTGDVSLTTVVDTYSYDIDVVNGFSSDVWRITDVYETSIDTPADVICYDAQNGVPAKVVFKTNPNGATYRLRCYKIPTEITSTSIQLQIPESRVLSDFYEGVCALIQLFTNGNSDRWMIWQKNSIPKILSDMNTGSRGQQIYTEYKGY